mmetsp:Transcript_8111/g.23966  ORF Transcript_8111/g.23966 Transcript_8111/m.23966 type:complete len:648 (-) Transcript_8111:245-2188(-)|eukprot:CAMPEP_0172377346 /NCGR_PEP_ID=MMETSP1060-20121228/68854_1 /TAXON_ID=37318 /ORGANISM="Pseudo-nitzschia pungens, Strain cf. cingulata" /LENGTH=647 /DNA_ID=CAMNT_0013105029 /DNA_START=2531 /DNA_END=4474 /DNA_ORIENTATION=-
MLRRVTSSRTGLMRRSLAGSRTPSGSTSSSSSSSRRAFAAATSAEKRALTAQQLKGLGSKSKAEGTTAAATPPAAEGAGDASGGGGGFGVTPVLALLVAAGGAGAAYSNGLLDEYLGSDVAPKPGASKPKAETQEKVAKKEAAAAPAPEPAPAAVEESLSAKELEEVNEIIADVVGEATAEVATVAASVEAVAKEAEAVVAKAVVAKAAPEKEASSPPPAAAPEPLTVVVAASPEPASAPEPTSYLDEAKILAEIEELKKALHEKSDAAAAEAHSELAKISSVNLMGLDLDSMTSSQLKVRLVQMARDLEERTKWEVVRLQEFLSMKEKEVEDRYVLLVKKLRLEAELLQEEKLAEQRKALTAQAEEALKEQQSRSDAFLENSMQIQEKAHEEDKLAYEQKTEEAMSAKYEELFGTEVAKIKEDFASKMNQRVQQMEQLTKKLADLESSLKDSQDFQVGSLEAHRITAAAIALMEKLESGEPAGAAVNALEAVASENAVVSAAVKSLPVSVTRSGISTIQELQTGFEEQIYPQCRRAANIPQGQGGLEGQLLGSIFATLRPPPGPEDAAPEEEKDSSEYVLSRIRRYVQLGDLEKAVGETSKLEGQVAYTVKDWGDQARDRVAVEKALKVIRMECALANENLSKVAA